MRTVLLGWIVVSLTWMAGCEPPQPLDDDDDDVGDDDDTEPPEPERDPPAPFVLVELFTSNG